MSDMTTIDQDLPTYSSSRQPKKKDFFDDFEIVDNSFGSMGG
jgi:hypothetical protein